MRGIERLDFADWSGEDAGLGDIELVLNGCVLLRVDIEPIVYGVIVNFAVALRRNPPCIEAS